MLRISKSSWHYRYAYFFWVTLALFYDRLYGLNTEKREIYETYFNNIHNLCSYFTIRCLIVPLFMGLYFPFVLGFGVLWRVAKYAVPPAFRLSVSATVVSARYIGSKRRAQPEIEKVKGTPFRKLLWAYLVGIKQKACPRVEIIEE